MNHVAAIQLGLFIQMININYMFNLHPVNNLLIKKRSLCHGSKLRQFQCEDGDIFTAIVKVFTLLSYEKSDLLMFVISETSRQA